MGENNKNICYACCQLYGIGCMKEQVNHSQQKNLIRIVSPPIAVKTWDLQKRLSEQII